MESEEGEAVNAFGGERLGLFKPRWGKEDFALHSGQRRGRVFSSKLWETASPSPALPLCSLAGHGQVPLTPAHLVPGAQTPFFCPSHLHQGRGLLLYTPWGGGFRLGEGLLCTPEISGEISGDLCPTAKMF